MRLRYRPSVNLLLITVLVLALIVLNVTLLQPQLGDLKARQKTLQDELDLITRQQDEQVGEADRRLLAQMRWTGADWTQATVAAMNEAQARTPGVKASYALGTAAPTALADDNYAAMRIDLELEAADDTALLRFASDLQRTLPGGSAVTALQLRATQPGGPVSGVMSLTLYRTAEP